MKRAITLVVLFVVSIFPEAGRSELRVVSTLPDFASMARELGGERVLAESLIYGTQDPHYVDAKPSYILKVNRADLLIVIGLGLEAGWLPVLLTQSRNPAVQAGSAGYMDASEYVKLKEAPAVVSRDMGDVHGGGNPHYYTSPQELHAVARAIHERLVELDPAGKEYYQDRWDEFDSKYREKLSEWESALDPCRGSKVVVYHQSWIYLLDWAGFERVGALEPKPGIPPNPAHVSSLLQKSEAVGAEYVFQEIYHPTRTARLFAEKVGARHIVLPSMVGAEKDIDTIWDKFDRIVELITMD